MWEIRYNGEQVLPREIINIRKLKKFLKGRETDGLTLKFGGIDNEKFAIVAEYGGRIESKTFSRRLLDRDDFEGSSMYLYITALAELSKLLMR